STYGCQGGCGIAQIKPLPAPLPNDQIIEGAVQMRVSAAGLTKVESVLPGIVSRVFADGLCVPEQRFGSIGGFASLTACGGNDCPGNLQGCPAHIRLDSTSFQLPDGGPLTVDATFDITELPVKLTWFGAGSCTMNVTTSAPAHVLADVVLATAAQSGELTVHLAPGGLRMAQLPLHFEGCLILAPIANLLEPLIN